MFCSGRLQKHGQKCVEVCRCGLLRVSDMRIADVTGMERQQPRNKQKGSLTRRLRVLKNDIDLVFASPLWKPWAKITPTGTSMRFSNGVATLEPHPSIRQHSKKNRKGNFLRKLRRSAKF